MWVGCGYFVGNKCLCHNGQYMDYFLNGVWTNWFIVLIRGLTFLDKLKPR